MKSFQKDNLEIIRHTEGELPSLPFVDLKNTILKKRYKLSIAFVSKKEIETISKTYKGDKTHKNVLSFPLEKDAGEIVMNLQTIRIEAKKFEHSYAQHLAYLVIHGMLHLAGFAHGSKMKEQEKCFMRKFDF